MAVLLVTGPSFEVDLFHEQYGFRTGRGVARRITDGSVLSVIRDWLNAPVIERTSNGERNPRKQRTVIEAHRKVA